MDWIDVWVDKLKQKMIRLNLRASLVIYVSVAVIACSVCYALTTIICRSWKDIILNEDPSKDVSFLNVILLFATLVYVVIAIFVTIHLFYKHRLKEPIHLLQEEMAHVSRDDLSYDCSYESLDELGEICKGCNQMRKQLIKNHQNTWALMEGQRHLNAAFAHDLRTPLTVMQGYTEMLLKYYPTGQISEEKLLQTLEVLNHQVERMKDFSMTMKEIHNFDSLEVKKKEVSQLMLITSIQEILVGLQKSTDLNIEFHTTTSNKALYLDDNVILEVINNLLSNAKRFAKESIEITLKLEEELLSIYVKDDGLGFRKEDLENASKPYYSSQEGHFGIGLTIAKTLCEKHGGSLGLSNSIEGGAIVCAQFYVA